MCARSDLQRKSDGWRRLGKKAMEVIGVSVWGDEMV